MATTLMRSTASAYTPPLVTDHGDLATITAHEELLADVARVSFGLLAQASSPIPGGGGGTPDPGGGGGGGGVLGTSSAPSGGGGGATTPNSVAPGTTTVPDDGGVLRDQSGGGPTGTGSDPAGGASDPGSAGGGPGSGGGSGGGDGRLPFTGYAVMVVAALGAGLASTGVAVRRLVGRDAQ